MERITKLEEAIKEYWADRTEKKKKFLLEHYHELKPEFYKKLNYLIDEQRNIKGGSGQRKIQSIYLHRLLTSVYTESYEVMLGIASSELYLDEEKSETYWFPNLVYKNIDEDMSEVERILRKKFVRLKEYELFQLKKVLLIEDWKLLQEIFLQMIKDFIGCIIDSSLQLESEVQILSGDYMDKPEILWRVSAERPER